MLIEKARQFAIKAHAGQVRKHHGGPYIEHPQYVATRLMALGASDVLVAAGWLHDVVEDCCVRIETIREEFGYDVAEIVYAVTSPLMRGVNRATRKALDRARLKNARRDAKLLKLVDLIHNLGDMPPGDFTLKYADESELLVEAIGDASSDLKAELLTLIEEVRRGSNLVR